MFGAVKSDMYPGRSSIVLSACMHHLDRRDSTQRGLHSLHHLSERLVNASSDIPAPTPAAARIPQRHFVSMLQNSWNSQVEALFRHSGDLDQRVVDWARKTLYGGEADRAKPE